MNFSRAVRSSALLVAVSLLLGGSLYVNAATPLSPQPMANSSGSPSGVTFMLVHVPTSFSIDGNATGGAGIAVQGQVLTTEISVNHATPGAVLQAVMAINYTSRSGTNVLGSETADSSGHASFSIKSSLPPGTYYVGLEIYDTTNKNAGILALASSPAYEELVVPSPYATSTTSTTSTSTTGTGGSPSGFTFTLVHTTAGPGANLDHNATGAGGVAVQGLTQILTEVVVNQATPGAALQVVMAVNSTAPGAQGTMVVVGTATVDSTGHAGFSGQSALPPGVYYVGLRILDASNGGPTMVLVSSPYYGRLVVGAAATTTTTTSSSTQTSSPSGFTFTLVHSTASANAPLDRNATGYGGLEVQGPGVAADVVVHSATPGAVLQAVMVVNSSAQSTTTVLATAVTDGSGDAGFSGKSPLGPGIYYVAIRIYDMTNNGMTLVLVSSPPYGRLVVPTTTTTSETTESTASTNWGFSLLPLPAYLHQPLPTNYSFREGGAAISGYGYTLQVVFSFLGAPNTTFDLVLSRSNSNVSLGTTTTNAQGGGVFKANTTLGAGTYGLGLLVFGSGANNPLVAVSVPRSVQVTVPIGGQSSTTTTRTTTYSTTQTSTGPGNAEYLTFTPISSAAVPSDYPFGSGTVGYGVTGTGMAFSGRFSGQAPNAHFLFVISMNGSEKTVGDYTTNGDGIGYLSVTTYLGLGTFVVSFVVEDASSFKTPTPVLEGNPANVLIRTLGTTSTTTSSTSTTTSSTTTQSSTSNDHAATFKLFPITTTTAPQGYRFGEGTAYVSVYVQGGTAAFAVSLDNANPSTNYTAALSMNGTNTDLGAMTTDRDGSAELHGTIQMHPGTYVVGFTVYDTSTFKAAVAVLRSDPQTQTIVVEGASTTTTSSTSTQSETTHSTTSTVSTISENATIQNKIKSAFDNLTIPAVVSVTGSSSSTAVLDPRFSVSVGSQTNDGLTITISGTNVTGPRVLLLNLSRSSQLASFRSLNVTLDGQPVAEASSATQVLNPVAGDPARYVVVSSAGGIQLLISIPHFSVHLISVTEVAAAVAAVQTALEVDAPLLAGSVLVVTLLFAGLYAGRRRVYTFL